MYLCIYLILTSYVVGLYAWYNEGSERLLLLLLLLLVLVVVLVVLLLVVVLVVVVLVVLVVLVPGRSRRPHWSRDG